MRHAKGYRRLNRTHEHRKALWANMAGSLIEHEQIKTTLPKAKELRSFVERLITYAKKNDLHGRRMIMKKIKGNLKKEVSNILIHEIAPNYIDRNGGYTRIVKLANRKNDDAKRAIIEFVNLENSSLDSADDENVSSEKDIKGDLKEEGK